VVRASPTLPDVLSADVRPPHVLEASLRLVKARWLQSPDYQHACEQLKSIRQVQTPWVLAWPWVQPQLAELHAGFDCSSCSRFSGWAARAGPHRSTHQNKPGSCCLWNTRTDCARGAWCCY